MEIRVAAPDAASAKALVWRLALRRTIASLDADSHQVRILALAGSRQEIAQVLATVESWLDEAGTAAAEVWLGDRRHTLVRHYSQVASGQ